MKQIQLCEEKMKKLGSKKEQSPQKNYTQHQVFKR